MFSMIRISFICLSLALFFPLQTYACTSGHQQKNWNDSNDTELFGAYVDLLARVASGDCDAYRTEVKDGESLSGQVSDSGTVSTEGQEQIAHYPIFQTYASATGHADYAGLRLTSSNSTSYDPSSYYHSGAELRKTERFYVTRPEEHAGTSLKIPYEICSNYKSELDVARLTRQNWVRAYFKGGYSGYKTKWLHYPARNGRTGRVTIDDYNGAYLLINHGRTTEHSYCFTGELELGALDEEFSITLYSFLQGTHDGKSSQGSIDAQLKIFHKPLPEGVTCYSASGTHPGCGKKEEPQVCAAPENDAYQFKGYTETDYAENNLYFQRIYQSDIQPEHSSLGAGWQHNYQRQFDISQTSHTTTINLTTENNETHVFRSFGDTRWETIKGDRSLILESISTGYQLTRDLGVKEYYDARGVLTSILHQDNSYVNLEYDIEEKLQRVVNNNNQSLEFFYNANNLLAQIITPDGVFDYDYDNQHLSEVRLSGFPIQTLAYDNSGILSEIANAEGLPLNIINASLYPEFNVDDFEKVLRAWVKASKAAGRWIPIIRWAGYIYDISAIATACTVAPDLCTEIIGANWQEILLGVQSLANEEVKSEECECVAIIYRVYGGLFAIQMGMSWTPIHPLTVDDYRNFAGLPPENTGEYMVTGCLLTYDGVIIRDALTIGDFSGGIVEYLIDNPEKKIIVIDDRILKPPL